MRLPAEFIFRDSFEHALRGLAFLVKLHQYRIYKSHKFPFPYEFGLWVSHRQA